MGTEFEKILSAKIATSTFPMDRKKAIDPVEKLRIKGFRDWFIGHVEGMMRCQG